MEDCGVFHGYLKKEKKIAIFIPVFNEKETLGDLLACLPSKLIDREVEIIIVDDNSTDGSFEIAKSFTPHCVRLNKNMGVGTATKVGFEYIASRGGYDFVIKFDGDGQHKIELLNEVARLLQKGNDIVVVSRFHSSSSQTHTPMDRILLNMIYTEMVKKITEWNLSDVRSGFMGLKFEYVRAIANNIIVPRYGIPMEILLRIWHINPKAKVAEISQPAIYGGNISSKLQKKYSNEQIDQKTDRLQMAYSALLLVVEDLNIPKERILEANGFRNY